MAKPEDPEWPRVRQEAVATLQSVLSWNLSPRRWEQAREVLTAMTAAVAAPSPAALRDVSETLELCTPVRVETRLGARPPEPVSSRVREQVAELVDSLRPYGARDHGGAEFQDDPGQAATGGA